MSKAVTRLARAVVVVLAASSVDGGIASVAAMMPPPPICDEVCTASTDCTASCYVDMMEFENGNDISCAEFGIYDDDFCCGDSMCNLAGSETMSNCALDCTGPIQQPTCGLYGCEQGENCENCPTDCGGSCGTAGSDCNYDGVCNDDEGKWCDDCIATGFCNDDEDCPPFQLNDYIYLCVHDQCVLQELPTVTTTCFTDADCTGGWRCTAIPPSYHGNTYICPGPNRCKVCLPRWVR